MNAEPQLARAIVRCELDAWWRYWDRDHPSQDHQLYVPGMILDLRNTLKAIDNGVDYGMPDSYQHIKICQYWIGDDCRRVLSDRVSTAQWRKRYAKITQARCDKQNLRLILWHPVDPAQPLRYEVQALGGLKPRGSASQFRILWMPWIPRGAIAATYRPVQLKLPLLTD